MNHENRYGSAKGVHSGTEIERKKREVKKISWHGLLHFLKLRRDGLIYPSWTVSGVGGKRGKIALSNFQEIETWFTDARK